MPENLVSPLLSPSAVALAEQIKKLERLRHGQAEPQDLTAFDEETEQLILRTFGDATDHLEAYELATMGEAETIVNMPQPAQEDATQDLPRKAIEQRRQVLESCLAELAFDASYQKTKKPSVSPAKKKKARASKKSTAKKKSGGAKKLAGTKKKKTSPAKKKKGKGRKRK